MQIILTEEEYTALKNKADNCDYAETALDTVLTKYAELSERYNNLLVFGISANNEKLKNTLK
jgi:hypothetical protein